MSYNIVIWRDPDGQYVARNLELGIVSQGYTVEAATRNIQEATALFLEGEDGKSVHQTPSFKPAILTQITR